MKVRSYRQDKYLFMTSAYGSTVEQAKKYNIHNRMGACIISLERVIDAMRLRGWL
jgi:glutamate dehydrogenase (NAD(P)+)